MNEEMNEKVEELKDVVTDISTVSETNKLVKDAGGKAKAGYILIGILSVLGLVKLFGLVRGWIKKIKNKRARKYAEQHPEEFVTREDVEKQQSEEEEKTLEDISEELRSK